MPEKPALSLCITSFNWRMSTTWLESSADFRAFADLRGT
jgi:hypothetical protein